MKKIISFLVALILVSSSFGAVSAQENLRSADEIRAEIKRVRKELDMKILKNQISHRTADKITDEEKIQKEKELLPIKDRLADLDYELAMMEGKIMNKDEVLRALKNPNEARASNGSTLQVGDIILFETNAQSSSFYENSINAGIFNAVTRGWGHAMLVLENGQGLHIWNGVNSQIIPVQNALDIIDYKRTVVKRIPLSVQEKKFLTSYARSVLVNKPYPSGLAVFSGWHSKSDSSKLYCSQGPWLAYNFSKGIDIDNDGGPAVYPVDIYNSRHGYNFILH